MALSVWTVDFYKEPWTMNHGPWTMDLYIGPQCEQAQLVVGGHN